MKKVACFGKYAYNYIYKDNLNMDKLEDLEVRVDKLESTIEILKGTIRELLVNNTKQDKVEVPNRLVSSTDTKIPKDRVFLQSILERCTNHSSQKFLQSLINNKYDTLTIKQKMVVDDIVKQI